MYIWKKNVCILLLLGGIFWICLLGSFELQFCSSLLFPYWFSTQMFYPLLKIGYWNLLQLLCCYGFLPWVPIIFAVYILGLWCWVHIYYNCHIFLMNWSFYYYKMFFFVPFDSFWLKAYFVWYKYSHLCSLLVTVYIKYLFPSLHFQTMCVLNSKISPIVGSLFWGLVLLSISHAMPFDWGV